MSSPEKYNDIFLVPWDLTYLLLLTFMITKNFIYFNPVRSKVRSVPALCWSHVNILGLSMIAIDIGFTCNNFCLRNSKFDKVIMQRNFWKTHLTSLDVIKIGLLDFKALKRVKSIYLHP